MALEIVWTKQAEQGYDRIIKYLEENWTEREIKNFLQETKQFFELLKQYPEMLQKTRHHKKVYRGLINKHTMLTYRLKPRKKQIELINVRSTRQKQLKR